MSIVSDQDVQSFEAHRRSLIGLAYRMLGSRAEAEDVVQDAYLRWHAADRTAIVEPRSYLGTVVTRLCLDRMKSATARRELYVGQWLPEPVVDEAFDAETAGDLAHDISVALIMLLERLSPLERASFLLHDVFGVEFAEVASALGREEAACRQLAARVSRPAGRVLPLRPRRGIGSPRRSGKPSIRATRRRWPGSWRKTRCSIPTAAASAPRR
jgi:RNA polymerase sigma-70 factor, ECF subfamily